MPGNGTNSQTWQTTDLGTAAYVFMQGLKLLGSRRESRGGRFVFMFADPNQLGDGLAVDYLNSESRKFDASVRSLKKLCHEIGGRRARA